MAIKKLIAKEFLATRGQLVEMQLLGDGYRYSYFEDPETGKFYRPIDGFVIIGDDLSDRFVEVESY